MNPNAKASLIIFPSSSELEMAVAYWNLVLTGRFKFLDLWNRFLTVRRALRVSQNFTTIKHSDQHCNCSVGLHVIFFLRLTILFLNAPAFRKITSVLFPRTRGTSFWTLAIWLQMTCPTTMRKVSTWWAGGWIFSGLILSIRHLKQHSETIISCSPSSSAPLLRGVACPHRWLRGVRSAYRDGQ